jgi:hypothetical protein
LAESSETGPRGSRRSRGTASTPLRRLAEGPSPSRHPRQPRSSLSRSPPQRPWRQLNPARPSQTEWLHSAPRHFWGKGPGVGARRAQRRGRRALCARRLDPSRCHQIPDRGVAAYVHDCFHRSDRRHHRRRRVRRGARCSGRRGDRRGRSRTACRPHRPRGW